MIGFNEDGLMMTSIRAMGEFLGEMKWNADARRYYHEARDGTTYYPPFSSWLPPLTPEQVRARKPIDDYIKSQAQAMARSFDDRLLRLSLNGVDS